MAKIIQFHSNKNETLFTSTTRSAELGIASFENIEPALLELPQAPVIADWDNQELADLYRVKQLLENAGVHIATDHGVSDEGDPWFVFCQSNGDVFVHLCRIDGIYLLDSPNMDRALRGYNFRELINGFIQRAVEPQATANIVSIHTGNNVLLHPAIMLTALIWSLYLASDELIGIAHAEDADLDGFNLSGELGPKITNFQGIEQIVELFQKVEGADPKQKIDYLEDINQNNTSDLNERYVSSSTQNTAVSHAVALGLTAIAVTYGIMKHSSIAILGSADEQTNEVQALLKLGDKQLFVTDTLGLPDEDGAIDTASTRATQSSAESSDNKSAIEISQVLTIEKINLQLEKLDQDTSLSVADTVSTQDVDFEVALVKKTDLTDQPSVGVDAHNEIRAIIISMPGVIREFDQHQGVDITTSRLFSNYTINETNIISSINIDDIEDIFLNNEIFNSAVSIMDVFDLTDGVVNADSSINVQPKFTEYGDQTRKFIDYLLSKGDVVEMIATAKEIVFLDMSAFDDASDVIHTQSWEFEDGGVISTIGHLQEFVDFGLV